MPILVVPYSDAWPEQFAAVASALQRALRDVPLVGIEHVGSTAVPGLAAKPVLDIDVIVRREHLAPAIEALTVAGYRHRGDLGVTDREAVEAPDDDPARNVYVCVDGTLHLRNHLAVRDILRRRPDLAERYGALKAELASDRDMDIETYIARKSGILQEVLEESDLSGEEKAVIAALNRGEAGGGASSEEPRP